MAQVVKTISFTLELDAELDKLVKFLNENRIDGAISKSKLIRVAVADFIAKQNQIKKILEEHRDISKLAGDLLRENGY